MRAGSLASATVCSTAFFNASNLSSPNRSFRLTRCATIGGVRAIVIGPSAKQHTNAIQTARRPFSFDTVTLRMAKPATSDTRIAARIAKVTVYGKYDRAIGSVGQQTPSANTPPKFTTAD